MPEQLIWTALPNGLVGEGDDRRLRLSVLVSPRLTTPDGAESVLSAFPDLRRWPSAMAATEFALEFGGATVADDLRPRNTLEPGLWDALFTDETVVRSRVFRDYSRHRLISYPFRPLRDRIQQLYASVAADTAFNLPVIFQTEPVSGLRFTLQDFLPQDRPPGQTAEAVAAFRRFHDRPARPNAPLPTDEQLGQLLDFHQAVACLSDYPKLLRPLGLVFDLEIPADAVPPAAAPRSLRVLPRWVPADPASPTPDISPATRSVWDGSTFAAASAEADILSGLLSLDETHFNLVDADIDGAVHKVVNLALNLVAITSRGAVDGPQSAGLPVLRSAGLSLVREGRAQALGAHLVRMSDQNSVLEGGSPESAVFDAEQLVRGYRVDIWDSDSRTWHSLCQRVGTYRFQQTGVERMIEDEGFVQLSAAGVPAEPGHSPPAPELYLHESMLRWTGWSLVAPRPGLVISADGDPAADPQRPENVAVTSFGLQTTFVPARGSLPTLRFGVGYRLRVRVVDLAGNSRSLEEADDIPALPATAPGQVYLRYEPVPSPVVVLREPLTRAATPGEALDRVVIRSANASRGQDDVSSTDTADRHIAPPRTTQALAEAHGAFDDGGRVRGDAATYQMIRARDAAQLDQDGDVPVAPDEQLVLPYLPDALARGAAFRDLPGAPEGTIGTVDDEGHLTYRPADVLRAGSVTQISFGSASAWPAMQPFRLLLREGSQSPAWDAKRRVLTVALPKGEVAEVALSCCFHRPDLELLGVWDWVRQEVDARSAKAQDPASLEGLGESVLLLTQRALEGGHWALTPARTLTLVHAVQQPLGRPVIDELVAVRDLGATNARLLGTIRLHPSSTGKIDLVARWDEVPHSGREPTLPAEDLAAELRLHHQRWPDAIGFGDRDVADYDPSTATILMGASRHPRHEFGDTKHRVVRYRAVATSRFSEHFLRQAEVTLHGTAPVVLAPEGIGPGSETVRSTDGATTFTRAEGDTGDYQVDNRAGTIARTGGSAIRDGQAVRVEFVPPVNRDSDEVIVHVPSSARPAAPRVLYVVPAFEWRRQTSTNLLASHRRGHWLRVYLDGPWSSSGEGEQLGVVVSRGVIEPQGQLARYVTRTALDVLRNAGPLPSDFPQGKRDFGPGLVGLTLGELEPTPDNRVNVYGHDVAFDTDRRLWYCDIEVARTLPVLGPTAFEPFIRLALARYQPHSVVEFDPAQPDKLRDVKLSPVVIADFAQLHSDRSVLVTYDPHRPARLRVVVSGDSYQKTLESAGPSTIEVSVQEREPGVQGDLAWVQAADALVKPDASGTTPPGAVLWHGDVVLPEDWAISPYRIVVEEWDTLLADDPAQPRRLLYTDALELSSATTGSVDFVHWTSAAPHGTLATGTLHGGQVTLSGPLGTAFYCHDTYHNFVRAEFSPQLDPTSMLEIERPPEHALYTLSFEVPLQDPILHLGSLGSVLTFPTGTAVTRLSGDAHFVVAGNAVTGGKPMYGPDGTLLGLDDSNGSVRLTGTFSTITFTLVPNPAYPVGIGDGVMFQAGGAQLRHRVDPPQGEPTPDAAQAQPPDGLDWGLLPTLARMTGPHEVDGHVKLAQAMLNAAEAAVPALVVDGNFGDLTQAAVLIFRTSRLLPPGEVIDTVAWFALAVASPFPLLEPGPRTPPMTGPPVALVQGLLNGVGADPQLDVDGRFGPNTKSAVAAFQTGQRLPVTGTMTRETWAALTGPHTGSGPSGTMRLTFSYSSEDWAADGPLVRFVSREDLAMTAPLSDDLETSPEGSAGFWYEVRDVQEQVLYRRSRSMPIAVLVEVPVADVDGVLGSVPLDAPRGTFELLAPILPGATTLVLFSSPPDPARLNEPASAIFSLDLT